LTDFELGISVSVEAENDWRGIHGLKLQCITIATFSSSVRTCLRAMMPYGWKGNRRPGSLLYGYD